MAESNLNKFKRLIDANYPAGERYADQKGVARKEDFNALLAELATKTTETFSVAARGPLIQALTTDGFFESAQGAAPAVPLGYRLVPVRDTAVKGKRWITPDTSAERREKAQKIGDKWDISNDLKFPDWERHWDHIKASLGQMFIKERTSMGLPAPNFQKKDGPRVHIKSGSETNAYGGAETTIVHDTMAVYLSVICKSIAQELKLSDLNIEVNPHNGPKKGSRETDVSIKAGRCVADMDVKSFSIMGKSKMLSSGLDSYVSTLDRVSSKQYHKLQVFSLILGRDCAIFGRSQHSGVEDFDELKTSEAVPFPEIHDWVFEPEKVVDRPQSIEFLFGMIQMIHRCEAQAAPAELYAPGDHTEDIGYIQILGRKTHREWVWQGVECIGAGRVSQAIHAREDEGGDLCIKLEPIGESGQLEAEIDNLEALSGCIGVPQVIDYGTHYDGSQHWLALATRPVGISIDRVNQLSTSQLSIVWDALVVILNSIHQRGYLVNDIKPEHIIISQSGLYLIDYGAAAKKGSIQEPKYFTPKFILSGEMGERMDFEMALLSLALMTCQFRALYYAGMLTLSIWKSACYRRLVDIDLATSQFQTLVDRLPKLPHSYHTQNVTIK